MYTTKKKLPTALNNYKELKELSLRYKRPQKRKPRKLPTELPKHEKSKSIVNPIQFLIYIK